MNTPDINITAIQLKTTEQLKAEELKIKNKYCSDSPEDMVSYEQPDDDFMLLNTE